jgi:hypothetical protein
MAEQPVRHREVGIIAQGLAQRSVGEVSAALMVEQFGAFERGIH